MLKFLKLVPLSKNCLCIPLFPFLFLLLISGCSSNKPVEVLSDPLVPVVSPVVSVSSPVPFSKDVAGLLKDLQHTVSPSGGISTIGSDNTHSYAITFGTNDRNSSIDFIELSEKDIQEFRVDGITTNLPAGTAELKAFLNVKYTVSGRSMQINGNMQSQGSFLVEYVWSKDASDKYSWTFHQIKGDSSTLAAVQL